ncbi:hypothetical protein [Aureivirga marina]|uniref:hypothetical protein n=1 Tax=Aureivirga marina TaxID=1182451 RepID=UPI0018CB7F33|nr:hypothetical protein [Aureivirga marina]
MNSSKNKLRLSIFFAIMVFIPSIAQFLHALQEEHFHDVYSEDVEHVYGEKFDCSIFHTVIEFLKLPDYNFAHKEIVIVFNKVKFHYVQELFEIIYATKNSRAPPF